MNIYIYIFSLILFCMYFYGKKGNVKFELAFLFLLIYFGPEILFRDISGYEINVNKYLPFINTDYLKLLLRLAYSICYVSTYYTFSKLNNSKIYRLAFFTITFATLGYNQLYLCFALLCFLVQHNLKNWWLRALFIVLSLFAHFSILVLYIYYAYKWNKKVVFYISLIVICVFFFNPYFYLIFSGLDERISIYTQLQSTGIKWGIYSLRSQIELNLSMLILSILIRNFKMTIFVCLVFIFSIAIKDIHAVIVSRTVELLYILYLVLLKDEINTSYYRVFIITMLSIYFINNIYKSFLFFS